MLLGIVKIRLYAVAGACRSGRGRFRSPRSRRRPCDVGVPPLHQQRYTPHVERTPPKTGLSLLGQTTPPKRSDFRITASEWLLSHWWTDEERQRMKELGNKAAEGKLTADERAERERCEQIADLLALLRSQADRSVKRLASSS